MDVDWPKEGGGGIDRRVNSITQQPSARGIAASDTADLEYCGQAFALNGFVALHRVLTKEWRSAFEELELFSQRFLSLFPKWGDNYPWPPDPLHCWFRPFEYPYVLRNLPPVTPTTRPLVLDVGTAVTFFPLFLSCRGYRLVLTDNDHRMPAYWHRVLDCVPDTWRDAASSAEYRISSDYAIPEQDDRVDAATCISVLEHVPDPPRLLREILRVVKPGGSVILTMDISLESNAGVSASQFDELLAIFDEICQPTHGGELVHPQNLICFPAAPEGLVAPAWWPTRSSAAPPLAKSSRPLWRRLASSIRRELRRAAPPAPAGDPYPSPRSLCLFVGTYRKKLR